MLNAPLRSEAAGGKGGAVVGAEHELARLDRVHRRGAFDQGDRFVGAAAKLELPGDDLPGAAVDDRVGFENSVTSIGVVEVAAG